MNKDDPIDAGDGLGPPPHDPLDRLLRQWHQTNIERAANARDSLMQKISTDLAELKPASGVQGDVDAGSKPATARTLIRRLVMNRYTPIAACLLLLALLIPTLLPTATRPTYAGANFAMVPEGGRLDALDNEGNVLGPCALKHTDVDVAVSGHFTRVTLKQQYRNPYDHKIEAVYTFPLSHRAAVDRMKMTIGDRVVLGEVHERSKARAIYEAAREQGYVASLLEQERPNIFTQSLANIEQNAEIEIEISYVELLESKDGTYSFDFPMVVGPRYIPGSPRTSSGDLPAGLVTRQGVILLGPANLSLDEAGDVTTLGTLQPAKVQALLDAAIPIKSPQAEWWKAGSSTTGGTGQPTLWYRFEAAYSNGARELGTLHTDGTGQLNGRWFYTNSKTIKTVGTGFSPDTTQVPDAGKITPQPVQPGQRAGHDISIKVNIDTGGPGILDVKSVLHQIVRTEAALRDDGAPRKLTVELRKEAEIPNRDFVLTWRQTADTIQEATFTHTGKNGNFITLILQPPARVEDAQAVSRELIFVLDTSGSMSGFPIEKAKEVMSKAMNALRPQDTFNLITFSGDTHILWDKPKPGSKNNINEAQQFLAGRQGGGGTEMMKAINAALVQTVEKESNTPVRIVCFMTDGYVGNDMEIINAIKKNVATTRVFSFGIGNSVNRYLLDGMAKAGRGEAEYILLNDGADEKVNRFAQRIQTPVLTDIRVQFSDNLKIADIVPDQIPDLFDVKPIILHGRYAAPGSGTITISGRTGAGVFTRTLPIDLPAVQPEHDTIATLWARTKVEGLMNQDLTAAQQGNFSQELKNEVVRLGETFGIMTQFTSFVAVEKARMTIGGRSQLVAIPIEMPQGVSYEGVFGKDTTRIPITFGFINDRFVSEISDSGIQEGLRATAPPASPSAAPQDKKSVRTRIATAKPQAQEFFDREGDGSEGQERSGMSIRSGGIPDGSSGALSKGGGSSDVYYTLELGDNNSQASSTKALVEPMKNIPAKEMKPILEQVIAQTTNGLSASLRERPPATTQPATPVDERAIPFLRQRAALGIAEFMKDGKLDDARKLADALVKIDGEFKIGVQMRDALADAKLNEAERNGRIAKLADQAKASIEAVLRDAKLRHRLDERLYALATDTTTLSASLGMTLTDRGIRVTVLTSDIEETALAALRKSGLVIEATAESLKLVVGFVPRERLADIALLDAVRRIDPTMVGE